ncbi:MAG: hypothetical protein WDW38_004874 [Sanguina aurantia]
MWGIYVGKQQQQRQQQRQQRQRQRTAETRGIAAAGRCFAVQRHWREPVPGLADQHSRVSPSGTCASTMNNQPPPGAAPSEPMGPLHAQTGQIWLDTRAEQLGLPLTNTSTASEPAGGDATGNTVLSKPPGCTLDMARAAEWRRQKNAVRSARKAEKESRRQEAMSHWFTSCEKCDADLDAWTAMYCKGSWGPYCQDCIDNDDELSGYSWDPKEEYWDR